jgi:hypothetical protein
MFEVKPGTLKQMHLPSWPLYGMGVMNNDFNQELHRHRYLLGITAADGECGKNGNSRRTS